MHHFYILNTYPSNSRFKNTGNTESVYVDFSKYILLKIDVRMNSYNIMLISHIVPHTRTSYISTNLLEGYLIVLK